MDGMRGICPGEYVCTSDGPFALYENLCLMWQNIGATVWVLGWTVC